MLRNNLNISSEKEKRDFARHLRTRQTNGERALWRKIRAKRFHGIKFRRQVPIGPYIVDFLYIQKKLIIEIDGDSHYEPGAKEKDAIREAYLREKGFNLLRFSNDAALNSIEWVLTEIAQYLHCDTN
ncbi:MAG: endonuclease domain-containing protein [Candidatus Peribacteraceae bacterium]|jgi:very-short-patch-repair endonuclease|nr:endonuclease domain-containing protein [Candidatus Peribacteraceae bacterium]MDP7477396.1 endonuclease domain-containing protein [Candidatus Peribacteraceae bacterium]